MLIENTDQRSKDYSEIAKRYRPGHADYTYDSNMACATIAAAAGRRRARPRRAWPPAGWRGWSFRA
jgi:chorismate synthase